MNTNCLIEKIKKSKTKLRPIILEAILNLNQSGKLQISAIEVREECFKIDNNIPWDVRIPAICSAMRKAIECGGRIVGENRDCHDFTISF